MATVPTRRAPTAAPASPAAADRLDQTLLRHQLRTTPVRRAVLAAISGKGYALSGADIEQEIGPGLDRITLFRTLRSFEQHGLLHRVPGDTDVVRYAACSIECTAEAHFDNHVHFRCTACARIYCLTQVPVPPVRLPSGFEVAGSQQLLVGRCRYCLVDC